MKKQYIKHYIIMIIDKSCKQLFQFRNHSIHEIHYCTKSADENDTAVVKSVMQSDLIDKK